MMNKILIHASLVSRVWRRRILGAAGIVTLCNMQSSIALEHPVLFNNAAEIQAVKAKISQSPWKEAWSKVKSVADAAMSKSGWNVQDTKNHLHAGGGGYTSDAYWVDRNNFEDFAYHLIAMGLARHLTGDTKYVAKAISFIDRFFFDSATYMKPVYLGDNMGTGSVFQILRGVDYFLNDLDSTRKGKMRKWAADYAVSLQSKVEFGGIGGNHNRADTWVICLFATGVISDNVMLCTNAAEHFKKRALKTSGELNGIGGGGGEEKYVMYSFVSFRELVVLVEMARHIGIDLYNYDVQAGRSKFERLCDFYANWAYHPENHPDGKTKAGSGEGDDVDVFEIVYSYKQKTAYKRVVDRIRPAFFKGSTSGPVTLTHAFGAFPLNIGKTTGVSQVRSAFGESVSKLSFLNTPGFSVLSINSPNALHGRIALSGRKMGPVPHGRQPKTWVSVRRNRAVENQRSAVQL